MNGVDLVILVVLAVAILGGFRQGFVMEVATILGASIAIVIAKAEYADLRHILLQFVSGSRWLTVIAYLLIFVFVWAAIILLARRIRFFVRLLMLGPLDRLAGAILGLLQGLVLVELLIALGLRVPNASLHHAILHSSLGPHFRALIPLLNRFYPPSSS